MSEQATAKEALKALRGERHTWIQRAKAQVKTQSKAIRAIRDQLGIGPCTVPEIAAATGASTAETLWYVAALKKYGIVREAEKHGSYFKYALSGEARTSVPD